MTYTRRVLLSVALANINRRIAVERNRLLGPLDDNELQPTAALIRALRTERDETIAAIKQYNF